MNLNISSLGKYVWKSQNLAGYGYQQVRNKWVNWMMVRDVKRRRMSAENFLERTRVNALRKNDVLPVEIREIADKEIAKFELNTQPMRINNRCVITSRYKLLHLNLAMFLPYYFLVYKGR
ncbi:hypothetical protein O3G_MSEX005273 [Manduca sexta]|uniref:Uncharacterized protein n=1 Tax=Manduca sexta TaxID=7130 RepID=A0A921YY28_MANSE|nr:hypothetical protein O3G_MSEX005273 [Manduca sexta]